MVRALGALTRGTSDVSAKGATVRTTLDVDRKLLDEVVKGTGERSKSAAVNKALDEYVRRTKTYELLTMAGRTHLDDTRVEQREADRRRQAFLDELRRDSTTRR